MKKMITILSLVSITSTAFADICAWAPDMNVAAINQALTGKTISLDGLADPTQLATGKVVEVSVSASDDTAINVVISESGKYDSSAQTITQADLGHMSLLCKLNNRVTTFENLAGALLKSGIACAGSDYLKNIPASDLNINCE